MHSALINKIIPFSSVDGKGNRTAIFTEGCNFNCLYCHNSETINICTNCKDCVKVCPQNALSVIDKKVVWNEEKCISCDECIKTCCHSSSPKVKLMTSSEVEMKVVKNIPYIRGITVSGGECTLYRDFLLELFKRIHTYGLTCLIDSNGTYDFENDSELLNETDGVMLDVKAFDNESHKKITSKSNEIVLHNLEFLASRGKLSEVRTVVVPSLFDAKNTIFEVSKILSMYKNPVLYKVIKYRPFGVRKENLGFLEVPGNDYLTECGEIIKNFGLSYVIV